MICNVCGLDDDHERWCPVGKQKDRAREDSETHARTLPPLMGSTAPVAKMRPRKVRKA